MTVRALVILIAGTACVRSTIPADSEGTLVGTIPGRLHGQCLEGGRCRVGECMVWRFDTWHYPYEVGKELRTCELLCDAVMTESSDCAGNLPCFTMKSTCPNNGPCATVFHDGRNHCLGPLEPEDAGN